MRGRTTEGGNGGIREEEGVVIIRSWKNEQEVSHLWLLHFSELGNTQQGNEWPDFENQMDRAKHS